ncbi:MAG: hypothetical protein RIC03_12635 [Cyclobacteriaceae bacterium]
MSFGNIVKNLFAGNGGIGGKIIDGIQDYFPAKLDEAEKANLKIKIQESAHAIEMSIAENTLKVYQEFNDRIKQMEGTASDLQQFGWLGKIVVFLRGAQRPMWGFAVMYMDFMIFSNRWQLVDGSQKENAFWIINFLVLGFLFGERAIKNIIPLVSTYLKKDK